MDTTTPVVFDFHNPWVALIQIALVFLLPQVVGLVTNKFSNVKLKTYLLGALALLSSALSWLLDVAVANAWATTDWTALVNVLVNGGITWFMANAAYKGILVPTGIAERAQMNPVIELFKADPKRLDDRRVAANSAEPSKAA